MSPWLKYFSSPVVVIKCQKRVCNLFVHHNNLGWVNEIRLRSRKHHWSALIITLLICALISVFSSFAKRSSWLQKDKVKWAVCSNVIGVVERSHYSDKNWEEGKKHSTSLTFAVLELFFLWSIWVFGSRLINLFLPAPSPSFFLSLSDHFVILFFSTFQSSVSSRFFPLFNLFTLPHRTSPWLSTISKSKSWPYRSLLSHEWFSVFLPFFYEWWGPGRAESASSLDPRPPPPSPGRRKPQSPSLPTGGNKKKRINTYKNKSTK